MIKPVPGPLLCVDERPRSRFPIVEQTLNVLVMIAGAGVLILLFAYAAALSVWSSVSEALELSDRKARSVTRLRSWRRTVTLFYLGTTASWTARRPALHAGSSSIAPAKPKLRPVLSFAQESVS